MSHQTLASPETLENEILSLASQLNITEYHLIKRLDAFDECGGWHGDGIRNFAHWLNWKVGMGDVMAREKIRVAKALRTLPKIDAAFAAGEVSYTKVRAMTRVATEDNESFLLQIAEYGTAQQMELLVRKFRSLYQQGLDRDAQEDHHRRIPSCNWFEDDQDMVTFKVKLPVDEAMLVINAINKIADQLYQENVSAETSDEQLQGPKADRSECRARALALLAEQQTPAPELLLHLQANPDNVDYKINGGPLGYDNNNKALPPAAMRRLTCDCHVTTVKEDDKGHILDIGRKSRLIPRSLRQVIKQRDNGCRYPGCCQTRWTDCHHIKHWMDGGETNLDNLVTLCRFHHTQLHKGVYRLKRTGDQLTFVGKTGQVIRRSINPQFEPAEPIQLNREPHRSAWQGDALDLDMALYLLDERTNGVLISRN